MLELKLCNETHIEELKRVAVQSYQEHYLYLWAEPHFAQWFMDKSFSEESLSQQMKEEQVLFYLVVKNGKNAGFIKLNKNKALPGDDAAKSLELERIYLVKEVSGKGLGTAVLNKIIEYCRQQGIEVIWLKSMDSSDSVLFYQKRGFVITASEQLPYEGFKEEYRTILTMRLEVKK